MTRTRRGLGSRVTDANAKWFTLAAACFALFMAILDNLVVNVALPTIRNELNASTTQLQWIFSAYTLFFASLQISGGGLGDRFGRKRWFLIGIAFFTLTSLMAAFATSIEVLLIARAVQGASAALIMPLSLSLISEAFPPDERGRALGIWSAVSVSGLALGPIVGGVIVEYSSWNWIFLINVPIGVFAFLVTLSVVRESRDLSGTVATDLPGTALITLAIGALTYGLIEAGERGWTDALILSMFFLAAVMTAAFLWVEAHTARPMVPLRFFRSRTFSGGNLDAFAISFLISGIAFSLTLYQQNVHGFSPIKTGAALLPMVLVMMVGAPISGILINKTGSSLLIAIGLAVTGISSFLFLRSSPDAAYLDIVPALIVMGLGMSLIFAPMTTAVLNSVETEKSGVASAVNGAVREIGTAFGIALLGTLMNRAYQARFDEASEIRALRSDPTAGPLRPVIDAIGEGIGLGGRVIEDRQLFPGLEQYPQVVAAIRDASSRAFVAGMDTAMIFSGTVLFVVAVLSYVLINDRVAAKPVEARQEVMPAEAVAD
ncbi:MAG TPA: MFS transporter [Thermomicrobiales bacterium]|nr:MFS transporter [Thermomicrobiales bacterium]